MVLRILTIIRNQLRFISQVYPRYLNIKINKEHYQGKRGFLYHLRAVSHTYAIIPNAEAYRKKTHKFDNLIRKGNT